jgi:TatD DNase family protein
VWTDSHCHIDDVAVIAAARQAGVTRLVNIGTDVEGSRAAIAVARAHDDVYATAGVHPHDAAGGIAGLAELVADPAVVAVGECGLDYHYDNSPRDVQRQVFAQQIALAKEHGRSLVIHTREAWDDTFAVLDDVGPPESVVFHCFTGGPAEADRALTYNAALSFSGILTFKGADDLRAAAAMCPADRVLVETDAPFLAPVPHRGQPNQPAWVAVVGAALAEVRGQAVAEVEALTWENATNWLQLRPSGHPA